MGFSNIAETMELMDKTGPDISFADKEFVTAYAFRTGDMELVNKLIEELQEKDADRDAVRTRYMQLAEKKPEWAEQIENLVIALSMYRHEEEKAVKKITEFLKSHGIDITESFVRESDASELRNMISEAKEDRTQETVIREKGISL